MVKAARLNPATILIVENEAIVSLELTHWLEKMGSVVLRASNADEAVTILETRRNIQIMITDIKMPGSMNGVRLAHLVRDRWPPVKIIVVSGMANTRQADLPKNTVFIAKPYEDQEFWGGAVRL
jgi:two-component system, response regulator PdtaR